MKLKLNGQSHDFTPPMTISKLLESLDLRGKPVVVELNEMAVFPREYDAILLEDGARVEIVALAAGG